MVAVSQLFSQKLLNSCLTQKANAHCNALHTEISKSRKKIKRKLHLHCKITHLYRIELHTHNHSNVNELVWRNRKKRARAHTSHKTCTQNYVVWECNYVWWYSNAGAALTLNCSTKLHKESASSLWGNFMRAPIGDLKQQVEEGDKVFLTKFLSNSAIFVRFS